MSSPASQRSQRGRRSRNATPATPTRRSSRRSSSRDVSSPAQQQNPDTSTDLLPMPSSSPAVPTRNVESSPAASHMGPGISEIDLSSPLNYGTPSSHLTGTPRTPRSSVYPFIVLNCFK
ncbi:Uncharacterised protein r2_g4334 [Pycnogonum litorale]